MTIIEQIKAEIERQMKYYDEKEMKAWDDLEQGDEDALWYQGHRKMCAKLLSFLSTLEESERPEPYNPVYDEAYLNEKIKKATESWKGVDVDAMLAECRGYDEEKSEKPMNQDEELNNEIKAFVNEYGYEKSEDILLIAIVARHFSQWQYQKDRGKFAQIKAKTWCEGFDACKGQMMKKAVEYEVGMHGEPITINLDKYVQRARGIFPGDNVRVIVLPKEDEK